MAEKNNIISDSSIYSEQECDLVDDLLVLYSEGMLHESTAKLVESHLKTCPKCSKRLKEIQQPVSVPHSDQKLLQSASKDLKKRQRTVFGMILCGCLAILMGFLSFGLSRTYLSWPNDQISIEEQGELIRVTAKNGINLSMTETESPDSQTEYNVEAWTTPLSSMTDTASESIVFAPKTSRLYFVRNNGEPDVLLNGSETDSRISLPRIGHKVLIWAAGFFGILLLALSIVHQIPKSTRLILQFTGAACLLAVLACFFVLGPGLESWNLVSDLLRIAFLFSAFCFAGGFVYLLIRRKKKLAEKHA